MTQKFIDIVARCRAQGLSTVTREIQSGLRGIRADIEVAVPTASQRNIDSLNRSLGSVNSTLSQISATSGATSSALNRVSPASRAVASGMTSIVASGASATSTMRQFSASARQGEEAMSAFGFQTGLALRRFSAFTLSAGSFIRLVQLIKEGTGSGIQFQREMVRISQVSGETGDKIASLAKTITNLSTSLGVSSQDLTQSAVVLKQAGLNIKETEVALGALAKAALAPNFDSLTQTSEGMIAIMAQFKQGAGALEAQLGSINAVAGEFAVEAGDLVTVIQKAGGTFKAAGGDLNELLAIFTSVRATTRESADQIATGLRTIFGRLQRADVVDSLKDLQINLRYTREEAERMGDLKLTNQFVGVFESFQRLSDGLNKLPDGSPQFSAIVEQIGGLRQLSRTIPAIREFGTAQKALQVAQAGSISLDIAKEKSQEALAVSLTQTKEKFLELFRVLTDDSGFKEFLKFSLQMTNGVLELTKALGPAIPLLGAYAGAMAIRAVASGASSSFTRGLTHGGAPRPNPANRFSNGDIVPGVGSGDKIPALLEPMEFIFSKRAVQNIGVDRLRELHRRGRNGLSHDEPRRYASGGLVHRQRFSSGSDGPVRQKQLTFAELSQLGPGYESQAISKISERYPSRDALSQVMPDFLSGLRKFSVEIQSIITPMKRDSLGRIVGKSSSREIIEFKGLADDIGKAVSKSVSGEFKELPGFEGKSLKERFVSGLEPGSHQGNFLLAQPEVQQQIKKKAYQRAVSAGRPQDAEDVASKMAEELSSKASLNYDGSQPLKGFVGTILGRAAGTELKRRGGVAHKERVGSLSRPNKTLRSELPGLAEEVTRLQNNPFDERIQASTSQFAKDLVERAASSGISLSPNGLRGEDRFIYKRHKGQLVFDDFMSNRRKKTQAESGSYQKTGEGDDVVPGAIDLVGSKSLSPDELVVRDEERRFAASVIVDTEQKGKAGAAVRKVLSQRMTQFDQREEDEAAKREGRVAQPVTEVSPQTLGKQLANLKRNSLLAADVERERFSRANASLSILPESVVPDSTHRTQQEPARLSVSGGGTGGLPPVVVAAGGAEDDYEGRRRDRARARLVASGIVSPVVTPVVSQSPPETTVDWRAAKEEHRRGREEKRRERAAVQPTAASSPDGLIPISLLGPPEAAAREEERARRKQKRDRERSYRENVSYRKPKTPRSNEGTFPLNADNYQLRTDPPLYSSARDEQIGIYERTEAGRRESKRQREQVGLGPNPRRRHTFVRGYDLQPPPEKSPVFVPPTYGNIPLPVGNVYEAPTPHERRYGNPSESSYALREPSKTRSSEIGADTLYNRRVREQIGRESVSLSGSERRPHDLLSSETRNQIADKATREQYTRTHRDLTLAEERLLKATLPEISAKEAYKIAKERATEALATGAKITTDAKGGILGTQSSLAAATFATNGTYQPTAQAGWRQRLAGYFRGQGGTGQGTAGQSRFSQFLNSGHINAFGTSALIAAPVVSGMVASSFGTAETAANSREGNVGYRAAQGISGGISQGVVGGFVGGAIGGAVSGSPFAGPIGAAVGATVFGLVGLVKSLNEADADIRQVKINTSLTEFTDRLGTLNQAGANASGSLFDASRNTLLKTQKLSDEKNRQASRGLLGGVDFDTFSQLQQRSTRQDFGQQLPGLTNFITQQADRLGRADIAAKVEDLSTSLLNGNNGLNREFISIIASIRGLSISQVMDDVGKTIKSSQASAKVQQSQRSGFQSQADSVGSFGRLTLSVQSAADGLQRLHAQAGLLTDLFQGTVGASHVSSHSDRLNQFGRHDAGALDALSGIRSVGGTEGEHLYRSGLAVDQVANVLPGLLASAIAKSREGENSIETISQSLPKALGYDTITKAPQEIQAVLTTILDGLRKADETGPGALADAVRFDATKFTDKLLEPLSGPLKEAGERISRLLQENANRFVDGLSQYRGLLDSTRQLQSQRDATGVGRLRTANQFEADNRGQGGRAIDFLSLRELQTTQRNQQARLVGGTESQNSDPAYLGEQLARARRDAVTAEGEQQRLFLSQKSGEGPGSRAFTEAATSLNQLRDRAARLQEALRNLGDTANTTAADQEKLGRLQEEKQSRLGFAEQYLNSDSDGRLRTSRGVGLIRQFDEFEQRTGQKGSLHGLSGDDQRLFVQTARSLGNGTFTGLKGGRTGNEYADRAIQNTFGFANLDGNQASQQQTYQENIKAAFVRAEQATDVLIAGQQTLSNDFFVRLGAAHEGFYTRLAAELVKDKTQSDRNEAARLGLQQGELQKLVDQKGELSKLGVDKKDNASLEGFIKQKGNLAKLATVQGQIEESDKRRRNAAEAARKVDLGGKSLDKTPGDFLDASQKESVERQLTQGGFVTKEEARAIIARQQELEQADAKTRMHEGGGGGVSGAGRKPFENSISIPRRGAFNLERATQEVLGRTEKGEGGLFDGRNKALSSIRSAGYDSQGVLATSSAEQLKKFNEALETLSTGEAAKGFVELEDKLKKLEATLKVLNESIPGGAPPLAVIQPGTFAVGPGGSHAHGDVVPGVGNKDSYNAKLMPGEFILTQQRTREIGLDKLRRLNNGDADVVPTFSKGGAFRPKPDLKIRRSAELDKYTPDFNVSASATKNATQELTNRISNGSISTRDVGREEERINGLRRDARREAAQINYEEQRNAVRDRQTNSTVSTYSKFGNGEFENSDYKKSLTERADSLKMKPVLLPGYKIEASKNAAPDATIKNSGTRERELSLRETLKIRTGRDGNIVRGDGFEDQRNEARKELSKILHQRQKYKYGTPSLHAGLSGGPPRPSRSPNPNATTGREQSPSDVITTQAESNTHFFGSPPNPIVDRSQRQAEADALNARRGGGQTSIPSAPIPGGSNSVEAKSAAQEEARKPSRQERGQALIASGQGTGLAARRQRGQALIASGGGTGIAARRQRALQNEDISEAKKAAIRAAIIKENGSPGQAAARRRDAAAQGNFNAQSAIYHAEDPGATFGVGRPDFEGQKNIGITSLQHTAQANTRAAQQNPALQQYQQQQYQAGQYQKQQYGVGYGVGPTGQSAGPGQFSVPPQPLPKGAVGPSGQPTGPGQGQGQANGTPQGGGLDPNVMASLTTGFTSFGTSATNLITAFTKFDASSKVLADALSAMPDHLDVNGKQEVVVHMVGGDFLTQLEPNIRSWIKEGVTQGIAVKFPDAS